MPVDSVWNTDRAGRALVLQPLVALDAARVVVLGLALLVGELDAVHAAVARVDHVEVVDEAAVDARIRRPRTARPSTRPSG